MRETVGLTRCIVELISVDRKRKLFQPTQIEQLHRAAVSLISVLSPPRLLLIESRLFPSNTGQLSFLFVLLVSAAVAIRLNGQIGWAFLWHR